MTIVVDFDVNNDNYFYYYYYYYYYCLCLHLSDATLLEITCRGLYEYIKPSIQFRMLSISSKTGFIFCSFPAHLYLKLVLEILKFIWLKKLLRSPTTVIFSFSFKQLANNTVFCSSSASMISVDTVFGD